MNPTPNQMAWLINSLLGIASQKALLVKVTIDWKCSTAQTKGLQPEFSWQNLKYRWEQLSTECGHLYVRGNILNTFRDGELFKARKQSEALLGFEPRISCLLDRRFNQLSHRALTKKGGFLLEESIGRQCFREMSLKIKWLLFLVYRWPDNGDSSGSLEMLCGIFPLQLLWALEQ